MHPMLVFLLVFLITFFIAKYSHFDTLHMMYVFLGAFTIIIGSISLSLFLDSKNDSESNISEEIEQDEDYVGGDIPNTGDQTSGDRLFAIFLAVLSAFLAFLSQRYEDIMKGIKKWKKKRRKRRKRKKQK